MGGAGTRPIGSARPALNTQQMRKRARRGQETSNLPTADGRLGREWHWPFSVAARAAGGDPVQVDRCRVWERFARPEVCPRGACAPPREPDRVRRLLVGQSAERDRSRASGTNDPSLAEKHLQLRQVVAAVGQAHEQ